MTSKPPCNTQNKPDATLALDIFILCLHRVANNGAEGFGAVRVGETGTVRTVGDADFMSVDTCAVLRAVHPLCRKALTEKNLFEHFLRLLRYTKSPSVTPVLHNLQKIVDSSRTRHLYFSFPRPTSFDELDCISSPSHHNSYLSGALQHTIEFTNLVQALIVREVRAFAWDELRVVQEPTYSAFQPTRMAALEWVNTLLMKETYVLTFFLITIPFFKDAASDAVLLSLLQVDACERETERLLKSHNFADRTWRRMLNACTHFDAICDFDPKNLFSELCDDDGLGDDDKALHASEIAPQDKWKTFLADVLVALRIVRCLQNVTIAALKFEDILIVMSFATHFLLFERSERCADAKSVCAVLRKSLWCFFEQETATVEQLRDLAMVAYESNEPFLSILSFQRARSV